MITVRTADELREKVLHARRSGLSIGLVPTMGALHDGHASLVEMSRGTCGFTITSIFINPTQFGPGEDLDRYPRTAAKDSQMLENLGCDLLFMPDAADMYDGKGVTGITVSGLGEHLCGASRPGHFEGVLLVVAKLLHMASPDAAFFGQKDAQQAVMIQRMVADLDFPVRIRVGPIVREKDGLAMSSRNSYLSPEERKKAVAIHDGLREAFERILAGERGSREIGRSMGARMEQSGFAVDYAGVYCAAGLQPVETLEGDVLLAAAGRMGKTRLIDNIALRIEGPEVRETILEFPEWSRYGWK
ncbi:MAG TPA: pantoate--beta-alanine ligase [Candidatus Krumholzibacterium sp.]|nr:pantoate--beta-alanine ligase [Candidatus Krumholzibacterium sp.]